MKDLIANIFELWGAFYMGDFSKYMYKADLYGEVGLVVLVIPLLVFLYTTSLWIISRLQNYLFGHSYW